MEKIELISLAKNYLEDFGYEIDEENTLVSCEENKVNLKSYKLESLDEKRKCINTSDIKFVLDHSLNNIDINANISEVVFVEAGGSNILRKAILSRTESDNNITLSVNNGKVVKTVNKKITTTGVRNDTRRLTNSYSTYIDVDNNYKLTDGYPKNNIAKRV